jgi:hypothetical protein
LGDQPQDLIVTGEKVHGIGFDEARLVDGRDAIAIRSAGLDLGDRNQAVVELKAIELSSIRGAVLQQTGTEGDQTNGNGRREC